MKKCYLAWNKDTVEDEVIFEHLKELSDGKLDLTVSKERLTTSATGMDIPRRKFVGPSSAGGATRGRTGNNNPSQMRHYNNNNSRKRPGQGQV